MSIDKLNIFLILISAVLAYLFPLELFILAYAILGPLHYVTEINWLHQKKYYFGSQSFLWLAIGIIASIMLFLPYVYLEYGNADSLFGSWMKWMRYWSYSALFVCLVLAFAYQFVKSRNAWLLTIILGVIAAIYLRKFESYNLIVAALIPTLIHVYLFTLLFMWFGAKKGKSTVGYFTVILALIIPLLYIALPLFPDLYAFNTQLIQIYNENSFQITPIRLGQLLGIKPKPTFDVYASLELRLMMFVSFAYLYHYLNWFSKTKVIRWHQSLDKKKTIAVIAIWLVSLLLYIIDYRLGFLSSLFLSFLHVILEFPLNAMSLRGVLGKS